MRHKAWDSINSTPIRCNVWERVKVFRGGSLPKKTSPMDVHKCVKTNISAIAAIFGEMIQIFEEIYGWIICKILMRFT